ncbi:BnaC09g31080D [Brassica napus]|uniref:BnaC09g31080D protein n=1 Tax=Brassica napus TaxID=3708 RepID=A0A078IDL5_BRANA|nr:BnaC09g31080D [Brassica napus]
MPEQNLYLYTGANSGTTAGKQKIFPVNNKFFEDMSFIIALRLFVISNMFKEIGRLSGKFTKRRLTDTENAHLQTYLLTNCEDVLQYER